MGKHSSSSAIARGALILFAITVVVVNAAVSWQFGSFYLYSAFGIQRAELASIAGGAYALLFLDVASLVWLFAYMRLAETSTQRGLALSGAAIAFGGSLLATAYMLAQGTAGVLATYADAVSTAAQLAMIVIVVIHAVFLTIYTLKSRQEAVTQTQINAASSATASALSQAESNVQNMVPQLANDISAAIEAQILSSLGFNRDAGGNLVFVPEQQASKKRARAAALPRPAANGHQAASRLAAAGAGGAAELRALPTPAPADQVDQVDQAELARLRARLAQLEDQVASAGVRFAAQDQPGSAGTNGAGGDTSPFPGPRKAA